MAEKDCCAVFPARSANVNVKKKKKKKILTGRQIGIAAEPLNSHSDFCFFLPQAVQEFRKQLKVKQSNNRATSICYTLK